MTESKDIYTEAFEYYKKMGMDPLPIPYKDGYPTKGPEMKGWPKKAADSGYTEADFAESCNIGILLGGERNLTDIDCDSPEAVAAGGDIMGHLMRRIGNETVIFGRQSKARSHYIHCTDRSLPSEKIRDPLTPTEVIVEYRCVNADGSRGQQTVFPPSVNFDPKTRQAERVRFEEDSASELAYVDSATLHRYFRMLGATALLAKYFPEHAGRHDTILALTGIFARIGMKEEEAVLIVTVAYRRSKGYNGDDRKAEDDVRSVYQTYAEKPTTHLYGYPRLTELIPKAVADRVLEVLEIDRPLEAVADAPTHHLTDTGNGRRLVDKHKDDIRYCVDDGCWYVWDGVRWRKDIVNRIRELAKGIADDLRREADHISRPSSTNDEDNNERAKAVYEARKRELVKWANQSENAERVSKTIKSAESDPRITCFRSDFDKHLHVLNCPNGVVNLYTGELMLHDRRLMLSSLCPTEFDPAARHSVWTDSVAAFTRNHADLAEFLRRVAGYSIQGSKTEERILVLYGPGNAGKGTFMDWLTSALGPDYACAMDANSVLKQKRDSAAASGDIARLQGKRLVVVSEIEKGSRLQESWMKQASGNDSLVARGLYQSEREFRPTHQFWFQSNYRPGFDATDSGNKRRYIEIPFDNDLKNDSLVKFDGQLKIRMRQDQDFLKAVLAWTVAGAVEWHQNGLQIPDSVQVATAALFAHNDFLSDFLNEMCEVEAGERVPVKAMWDAYESWCQEQGEDPAQGRTFNRMLEERGFERKQARVDGPSGKAWIGIRLREHDELMRELDSEGSRQIERGAIDVGQFKRTAMREKRSNVLNHRLVLSP